MPKKVLSPLESVLRTNVIRLVEKHLDGKPGRLRKVNPRARLETLQDIVNGKGGCNVGSLGPIAEAFGLKPYQLLIRDLDVDAPQEAVSAKQMRAIKELRGEG